MDDLVNDVFPSTVKFLTAECQTALLTDVDKTTVTANHVIPGVTEVSSFLHIFSTMLDKFSKRAHTDKKMKAENIGKITLDMAITIQKVKLMAQHQKIIEVTILRSIIDVCNIRV